MEAKQLSELLWNLAQDLKRWKDERGKAGRIIPGRDNDLLSWKVATGNAFELAYSALLLGYGPAAEDIRKHYNAVEAALSITQIDDPQQWYEALFSAYRRLVVRCQLLARDLAANETGRRQREDHTAIKDRFTFLPGQALFDGKDLELPSGEPVVMLRKLVDYFGRLVPYKDFWEHYDSATPGTVCKNKCCIVEALKKRNVPCEIKSKSGEGYFIRERKPAVKQKKRVKKK